MIESRPELTCRAIRPTRPERALARASTLLVCMVALTACNPDTLTDTPPATCTESGVQCQLAAGPLGVCERAQCGPDETAPCFQCTPQH